MIKYSEFYRAKVLDNNDPDQLGRIKVEVYPMLLGKETARLSQMTIDGIATEDLPWAVLAPSLFVGSGTSYGVFSVPEINTFVFVFFEAGDINQPIVFAEAPTATKGLPDSRLSNYPAKKVLRTKNGVEISIDDSNGNIAISSPGQLNIIVTGNVNLVTSGNANIEASGDITIKGATVSTNP